MKILVTGTAGFIGFHLSKRLLARGDEVVGIDNLNAYYDVVLKEARLGQLQAFSGDASVASHAPRVTSHESRVTEPGRFTFHKMDIADRDVMERLFENERVDRVVHLAAQAGVRYSLENPHAYVQSNVVGFLNVLEGCRRQWCSSGSPVTGHGSRHLVYASSSSVYGINTKMPFSVRDNVDHPISLYAATKKADELMAHTYSYLYGLPTTGLRFFTVYGPWGRPDMALFKFTRAILEGQPIDVYNEGKMRRDFTYIDDIIEGVVRVMDHIPLLCKEGSDVLVSSRGEDRGIVPRPRPRDLGVEGCHPAAETAGSRCSLRDSAIKSRNDTHEAPGYGSRVTGHESRTPAPYRLYNIGNHSPVQLMDFIAAVEEALGKKARMNFLPMQPGDVPATYADVDDLKRDVGFQPATPIQAGIRQFIAWYNSYYR